MKKQYMQPATLLTTVAMQQMVCESLPIDGTENNRNNLLSRRRGRRRYDEWDDEEEEEEGF